MFFYAGVVEAAEWTYTDDPDVLSIEFHQSFNDLYPYSVVVDRNYISSSDYVYSSGGVAVYEHTAYYAISSELLNGTTTEGAVYFTVYDSPTFSADADEIISSTVEIKDIRLLSYDPDVQLVIADFTRNYCASSLYLNLAIEQGHFTKFQFVIAVTYEYYVSYAMDSLMPMKNYVTPSNACSINYVWFSYTEDEVLSNDTEAVIGNQESIAESQMQQQESIAESQAQQSQEQHEETKGFLSNIVDGILDLPGKILDVLVSVFVPDAEYFSSLFDEMNTFFSERFGLLYYPFEIIIDFASLFTSPDSSGGSVPFPEISWEGTTIISAQDVEIIQDDSFLVLQERLYFVGNVIMAGALINLAHKKINEVMRA